MSLQEMVDKKTSIVNEMRQMHESAKAETRSFTDEESKAFSVKEQEVKELESQIAEEQRSQTIAGFSKEAPKAELKMEATENRSALFAQSGKTEMRAVLSTGTIAKPTKAGGINGLGEVGTGIVDDVNAIALTGNGAWVSAYKDTDASAAAVTDGSAVGGTASTYNYVTINPAEWGILDEISNQVRKMTPVDYLNAVETSALVALRSFAASKIVTNVLASPIAKTRYSVALNADYVRDLVLNFRSIEGKGNVKLYINQADLITLAKVRGTNEKKAVFDITFDAGTTTSGVIQSDGTAVPFRVLDTLTTGTQLFGQPGTIDMPMWDNYTIATDEGGDYFKRNVLGIRGLQTANADLAAKDGMHIIKQAASE